ncbi:EAL domain-containing protein [Thalassococcus sp. S3]|uniref:EAL domain-containing protein n=1 Tax=Thalassococcus sp. S3 TaxID=2017482 RepID=UPI001023F457|nr:EAL domain-containing protein [Thalassococcus sp. S3]QBF30416.1 diguanylate phosphodiesterase [Thalassococcus sp. S3]
MPTPRQTALADLSPGLDSPLNAALAGRDGSVLDMVSRSLTSGDTLLAFQPIMAARPPHGVAFYEGLIRVLDETGRVIPARDFMPAIEDSELGREIDVAALQLGLRTLVKNPTIRLSINMSARSIGYKTWKGTLDRFLRKHPTVGERLVLEITESSAMTVPEIVIDFMNDLQTRGIGFALDDFGSGMTAFRYFKDFYFDAVKIDGQFVRGVHSDPDNQVLTRALVAIAQQFDMFTVAESVEQGADAEFLVSIGVDCLQGYLYGAPTVRPPWLPESKVRATA